ncbi:hypothetical protein Tco_0479432 [Tanacetum coccineum]
MTTLVKHIIVAGAENHPPMLEKSMYDSWSSRIRLFIKGKKHGRMMLDSIDNDDYDVQATNIILHGLPPDVYALVNHQEAAKDIWDRVKLLMKGTELSYQERECRLYNLFDKFAYVQAKSLYTTNYDQLYAYLSQHEQHANEVRIMHERYLDLLALVANSPTLYNPSQSPQHSAFQSEGLDAYDSDCNGLSSAKVILMENLSSCDSDILFEESQDAVIQDTNPSAPNDLLVLSLVEQMTDHVAHLDKENQTNKMEIDTLKETLSNNVKEKESLSKTLTVFKTESKEKESKYIDKEIVLEKQNKELENIIYLNSQLQEKVFAIATLKNELRKLKGKNVADTAVLKPNDAIAPRMFKLDIEPISHSLKNNKDTHEVYIEKTIENTDTLHGFVERARTQNPSEPLLESACVTPPNWV